MSLQRFFLMPRGGVYGNSAYSISCLHELSSHPQLLGCFGNESIGGFGAYKHTSVHDVMRAQLLLFCSTAIPDIDQQAYLYMRHDWGGYENNTIRDQVPHFLLAFWYHAVNTGDKALVNQCWPAVERVANYLLHDMRMSQDALATVPGVTGLPGGYDPPVCTDPNQHICPSNWYDILGFGGQDGLINALAVQALNGLTELAEWLGNDTSAAGWRSLHNRARVAYNSKFWDEARGAYGDWVDTAGVRRFYLYAWHNMVAINPHSGIANQTQAAMIMAAMRAGYLRLQKEFNVSASQIFCTPTNFIPVAPADLAEGGRGGPQLPYPAYENGACFLNIMGLELAALGLTESPEDAYERFKLAMEKFSVSQLWGQHINWNHGTSTHPDVAGGDIMQSSLVLLWGFIRGVFGAWPDLHGIRIGAVQHGSLHRVPRTVFCISGVW